MVELFNADDQEGLADTPVMANIDGRSYEVPAGTVVRLKPGESITPATAPIPQILGRKRLWQSSDRRSIDGQR